MAVCACLAVLNSIATPASEAGALVFAAIGLLMVGGGFYFVRDRRRV